MSDVTEKNVITVKSVFFNTVILIYLYVNLRKTIKLLRYFEIMFHI